MSEWKGWPLSPEAAELERALDRLGVVKLNVMGQPVDRGLAVIIHALLDRIEEVRK